MNNCTSTINYLNHLEKRYGYRISIKDYTGFIPKDRDLFDICDPFLIHKSAFCSHIKYGIHLYERCQDNTLRLEQRLRKVSKPFVGKCFCGCYELIIPIKYQDTLLASIAVGGMDYDRKKSLEAITRVARDTDTDPLKMLRLYDETMRCIDLSETDINIIITHLGIVADFLLVYYKLMAAQDIMEPARQYSETANKLYAISNAVEYIAEHYQEHLSVKEVSAYCGCSRSYFSHMFGKYMGFGFNTYVNKVRIARAKELLLYSDDPITAISNQCGYSDPNYFSVAFRKVSGCSPSNYRRSHELNSKITYEEERNDIDVTANHNGTAHDCVSRGTYPQTRRR